MSFNLLLYHFKCETAYQERDEVKRLLFKQEIALYVPQDIVYIDESGMDSREDYSYGWNAKGSRFYA